MNSIRWNRSDIAKLSRAISKFNSIAENADIEKINYQELKSEILTRKELNRQIEKLKRLTPENASKFEESERKREIKIAERRLKRMLKGVDRGQYMGNTEYQIIEGELKNIRNLDNLGKNFRSKKLKRIEDLASSDYEMKEAQSYKDWYIQTLDDYYSGFNGYKELRAKIINIKNPISMYSKISPDMNASDIYYLRYSGHSQELFNKILRAWGMSEYEEEYEET